MKAALLAGLERHLRPLLTQALTPQAMVKLYSKGRQEFLRIFDRDLPFSRRDPFEGDERWKRELWGLTFGSPVINAAGMFKNGEAYRTVANQGAGGYLAGTATATARAGNKENGVKLPFVPFVASGAAANFLGLPGKGDYEVAFALFQLVNTARNSYPSCPIGVSVMRSPDYSSYSEEFQLNKLIFGMKKLERAGADFIEMNESCPNTNHDDLANVDNLQRRLQYISEHYLSERDDNSVLPFPIRDRPIPVVVKFSNDTDVKDVARLMDMLFELGYDGVNFGNTSTDYKSLRDKIVEGERELYDHFTSAFGGGISGRPLKEKSLELTAEAVRYRDAGAPSQEFHVIRTGGIENAADLIASDAAGVSLSQWFTGYWEMFSRHGHSVYDVLKKDYLTLKDSGK